MSPLVIALLLGLKHALDPDHLAAVFNMTISGKVTSRSAAKLGASWGVGHAISMVFLGIPVILFSSAFPEWFYTSAELGVGLVIIYLALKLSFQWFKGEFHPHNINNLVTTHLDHRKSHRRAGFMGMLHGVGGSYPAALLMLAAFSSATTALLGLTAFVSLSIMSMIAVTTVFSYVTLHHRSMHILDRVFIPILFVATFWFGTIYVEEALKSLGVL